MNKFIKKPVEITAIQWTGDNLKEIIDFIGKHPRWDTWFKSWEEYEEYIKDDNNVIKIFTLEGVMDASLYDWIIRGVQGEFYPCKPDIFEKTYEPSQGVSVPANTLPEEDVYLTPIEFQLCCHALGISLNNKKMYRNHFVTGEGSKDYIHWVNLTKKKLAIKHNKAYLSRGDALFTLTEDGIKKVFKYIT